MSSQPGITHDCADLRCWVIDSVVNDGTLERLADARKLAGGTGQRVGALVAGDCLADAQRLIEHGADHVYIVPVANAGQNTFVAAAASILAGARPPVVFAPGDAFGRACACRIAARLGWQLVSPALAVRRLGEQTTVTALDASG